MPSKSSRPRRQRHASADTSGGSQAAASGDPTRSQRRAASRKARSSGNSNRLIIFGVATVVVGLIGVGIFQVATGAGAASNFNFRVYQGEETLGESNVNFASLLGNGRPVVLNFWGGDCPPCRAEMPALQSVHDALKDEMLLLGLDVAVFFGLGTRQSALTLLNELDITYPAGTATNSTPMNDYVIDALPSTVFFGGDGEVFQRFSGAIREGQLESVMSAMLKES